MPEAMERALKVEAARKGFTGKRKNKYVYGTMRKTGWKPNREALSRRTNRYRGES